MSSDLIFHVANKRKWKESLRGSAGRNQTEEQDEKESVICVLPERLSQYVNTKFGDRKQAMLLVLDRSRLIGNLKVDKEEGVAVLDGGINADAILDRIVLKKNEDGVYDIEVTA
ncbi:MAG: hypothetical protein R3220_12105 [Balneolaceae bacterium]|nr:hypothetical protein [Balneolaceae bacterium]